MSVRPTSSAGHSSGDEESKPLGQQLQFPQTSPAPTGELGGFSPVTNQQAKGHHHTGDQCCCHTGTKEDQCQSCCMKSWTKLILLNL